MDDHYPAAGTLIETGCGAACSHRRPCGFPEVVDVSCPFPSFTLLSQPSDLPRSVASTVACSFTTVVVRHRGYGLCLLNARSLGRASLSTEVRPELCTDLPEMEPSEFSSSGQKPGAVAQPVIPITRETESRESQV